VQAYTQIQRTHEVLADNRLRLSVQLNEMAEQLIEMGKEVEKNRKVNKELGNRLERNLVDSEGLQEKCKARFDQAVEELERVLLSKAGENSRDANNLPHEQNSGSGGAGMRTLGKAIGKLKGGPKNPAQLQRLEEEARAKMNSMSDAYRQQVLATQTIRQEYFHLQLPRMLKVSLRLPRSRGSSDCFANRRPATTVHERVPRRDRPRDAVPPLALRLPIRKSPPQRRPHRLAAQHPQLLIHHPLRRRHAAVHELRDRPRPQVHRREHR